MTPQISIQPSIPNSTKSLLSLIKNIHIGRHNLRWTKKPEDKGNGLESSATSIKNNRINKINLSIPKPTLKIMVLRNLSFQTKNKNKISKKLSKGKGHILTLIFKKVLLKRHHKDIQQIMKRFENKWKGNNDYKNKNKKQIKIFVLFCCLY